ncbi:proline dehydrogenase [Durotheca rogersii]|uniref:proline dehydrogenase n=1 Tax=Durotheca rogersii TaxID=419775 RepID=UPI00221F99ED|nr:proline dehydrogenase [Durotheca rogersii]KAI5865769.1 proline dehydrogenase [Durotheca rogersii]
MVQATALGRSSRLPVYVNTIGLRRCSPYIIIRHGSSQTLYPAKRTIHSSPTRLVSPADQATLTDPASLGRFPSEPPVQPRPATKMAPLSVLPLSAVLRNLATTSISSSRILLPPSLAIMNLLAHTNQPVLNPDKNPLLRWFLKGTFYAQFCAGENAAEVRHTIDNLKKIGFTGVILGYAKEIVLSESQTKNLTACDEGPVAEECVRNEIGPWAAGTLATVRLAQHGDFVALKFSGAGRQAMYALKNRLPPPKHLRAAIDEICELAAQLDVPLLFDAEQTAVQAGIDDWTLEYQRKYNMSRPGHAIIYGTYQAYLKATPSVLGSHLATAAREGFTLGVKLVRGAYLGSDPRHIIHDTKAETDAAYDGIAASLIRRQWGEVLKGEAGAPFPRVSIVLGSHNLESVRRARELRESAEAAPHTELAIGQLQGMADEVSCELVAAARVRQQQQLLSEKPGGSSIVAGGGAGDVEVPRAYKYIVWGTTGECMKYLLRRAYENRDAVARTRSGRDAMWRELGRRVRVGLGIGA